MPKLNITSSQLNVIKQKIQRRYLKIELLNSKYQTVDYLEGCGINGSITVDANSDMRRSATLKFVVTDSSFDISPNGKIWMDKFVRLYLGIYSIAQQEIIYTKLGIFVIDAPSYEYDAVNNSVELSLLDLMSKLSGIRNGYLPGVPFNIEAGENIRNAMINTLELGGFTKYVCANTGKVPNKLSFNQGSTVYNILCGLRDIYPSYQIYFDVDGIFHYEKIPTGKNEPIQMDDTLWKTIVVSEKENVDFQNVKNSIEVYGRTHDPSFYCDSPRFTTYDFVNGIIECRVSKNHEDLPIEGIYGIKIPANLNYSASGVISPVFYGPDEGPGAGLGGTLVDDNFNIIQQIKSTESAYICLQAIPYNKSPTGYGVFKWLGHLQSYALAEDTDPTSPFYVNGTIGRIRLPLFAGEYENCFTDNLAMERAKYELYKHTRLQDTITINCLPVPWLDVNVLVEYTPQKSTQPNKYLIQSFSYGFDIDDSMTITMSKYYPDTII